jgi:hypothetical protein
MQKGCLSIPSPPFPPSLKNRCRLAGKDICPEKERTLGLILKAVDVGLGKAVERAELAAAFPF